MTNLALQRLLRLAWLRTLKYSYTHCVRSYLSSQFSSWPGSQVICIILYHAAAENQTMNLD